MMVRQTVLVVPPSDIQAVRLQCTDPACDGRVAVRLNPPSNLPKRCPFCQARWELESDSHAVGLVVRALRALVRDPDPRPVTVEFEIDEDDCAPTSAT